jgi:hypothetical protein
VRKFASKLTAVTINIVKTNTLVFSFLPRATESFLKIFRMFYQKSLVDEVLGVLGSDVYCNDTVTYAQSRVIIGQWFQHSSESLAYPKRFASLSVVAMVVSACVLVL